MMSYHFELKPVPRRQGSFIKGQKPSPTKGFGWTLDQDFDQLFAPDLPLDTTGHQTGTLEF